MLPRRFLPRAAFYAAVALPFSRPAQAPIPTSQIDWTIRQQSNTGLDIVIVAHADDWQIFLGDAIVERIKSGRRPVFIYLTAGDHGRDSVYWRQREIAALQSTRVAVIPGPTTPARCDAVRVESHSIRRCALGGSESFFLRLPDGNRSGAGFARDHFESLRKLRSNRLAVMH